MRPCRTDNAKRPILPQPLKRDYAAVHQQLALEGNHEQLLLAFVPQRCSNNNDKIIKNRYRI